MLEDEEYPGSGVKKEVEPVYRTHRSSLSKHRDLLDEVGRKIRSKPERETGKDYGAPG